MTWLLDHRFYLMVADVALLIALTILLAKVRALLGRVRRRLELLDEIAARAEADRADVSRIHAKMEAQARGLGLLP